MNQLKLVEPNGLIKIYETDKGTKVVDARELHKGLGSKQDFSDWAKSRLFECDAIENTDFTIILGKSTGGRPGKEYLLKLDIAKEMAMLERNDKGKEYRKYLIQVEEKYKSIQVDMSKLSGQNLLALAILEAQKMLEQKDSVIESQHQQIEQQKPKVLFADAVTVASTSILIGDLAKILKQNGINTGANRLFEWLRTKGYLIKRKGSDYNSPTQLSMNLGLIEVKETIISHADGHTSITKTPKVTGKGQVYFINKFLELKEKENEEAI